MSSCRSGFLSSAASFYLLVFLLVGLLSTGRLDAQEPRRIFDGTLDGWEADWNHWRIENETIVGEIPKGKT
ncbi:MAG: hypothetical protein ACK42H_08030, partial [Planctomycetota bacterium]